MVKVKCGINDIRPLVSDVVNTQVNCNNNFYPAQLMTSSTSNFSSAIAVICAALPLMHVTLLFLVKPAIENGSINSVTNVTAIMSELRIANVQATLFFDMTLYFDYLKWSFKEKRETSTLILSDDEPLDLFLKFRSDGFAHRLLLFVFYWGAKTAPTHLQKHLHEPLKVVILTNPRQGVYRIYYNQATPLGYGTLSMVNWYTVGDKTLYNAPMLPPAATVYKQLKGRIFYVPALHAPPWHFVHYTDSTPTGLVVTGGRDNTLLRLLSRTLDFRYEYLDPPERTQGSAPITVDTHLKWPSSDPSYTDVANVSYTGGLGMLQRREADLFLGDVTMNWERAHVADFSFLTLADSGAFATQSPQLLSEALALVRPFRLEVWPPLALTVALSGPALYMIIATPLTFKHSPKIPNLFTKCVWYTTTLFLRQGSPEPDPKHGFRSRCLGLLLWFSATYVLGDVYSAQLTSQLARPARESPVNTLPKLEAAVRDRDYQVLVERQSASLALLQNGTGVFGRLHSVMLKQPHYLVRSVEEGVIKVLRGRRGVAIMGGLETLYFNVRKYGAHNFQLSEKLYTRYSAVAVQAGSPYLESLNHVLMKVFEAGILDKITSKEYERMFGAQIGGVKETQNENKDLKGVEPETAAPPQTEETKILEPIRLPMLQGAFLVLIAGYTLSGITLLLELHASKKTTNPRPKEKQHKQKNKQRKANRNKKSDKLNKKFQHLPQSVLKFKNENLTEKIKQQSNFSRQKRAALCNKWHGKLGKVI